MKKIIIIFILFINIIISSNVKAETPDANPPTLNSWSLTGRTFKQGDTITFTVDAVDDISGVSTFEANFRNIDDTASLGIFTNLYESGNHTYTYKVPITAKPGVYNLTSVRTEDKAMNLACKATTVKSIYANPTGCLDGEPDLQIIIEDNNVQKPSISNYYINKKTFNVGETLEMSVDIVNAGSNPTVTAHYYADPPINITLNRVGNTNNFKGSIKLNRPGNFKFHILNVYDPNSTYWQFVYTNLTGSYSENMIYAITPEIADIEVAGDADTIAPTLTSVKIDKASLSAPGTNKVTVVATDNVEIDRVQVGFSKKGTNKNISFSEMPKAKKISAGKYEIAFSLNQYAEEDEYYINDITIVDTSGNGTTYYAFDNEKYHYEKLDYYSFNVVKSIASEEITSTDSRDAEEKINRASDNAIIAIDSTRNSIVKKALFESIKGTNKKLYIESNGIQWIFYGKDIVNETKDIDVRVNINTNENSNGGVNDLLDSNSLIINFAPNGVLPGIVKVRIKAEYTFRNYVGLKDLYVYYYDETNGILDPVAQKLDMTEDGYYEFFINHNSTYILSAEKPNIKYISNKKELIDINKKNIESDNYSVSDDEKEVINIDNNQVVNKNEKTSKSFNILNNIIIPISGTLVLAVLLFGTIIFFRKKIKINIFKKRSINKNH